MRAHTEAAECDARPRCENKPQIATPNSCVRASYGPELRQLGGPCTSGRLFRSNFAARPGLSRLPVPFREKPTPFGRACLLIDTAQLDITRGGLPGIPPNPPSEEDRHAFEHRIRKKPPARFAWRISRLSRHS